MESFNRIVTTLVLLALIPIVTVGLIAPRETIELLRDVLDQVEAWFDPSMSTAELLLRVAAALLVDGFLVFLLYSELRRPKDYGAPVHQVSGGEAQIAIDSIASRLVYRIDQLPGVLNVQPSITSHRRGVDVTLEVEVAADVNMPANIEQVSAVTRRVIEEEMGLKLRGKPKLNVRLMAYPEPETVIEFPDEEFPGMAVGPRAPEPTRFEEDPLAQSGLGGDIDMGEVDEPGSADASG